MKKQMIRNGVFETNSSSAHSLSVADENKDFVLDTIYPNENGVIVLNGDEFGWGWFKTNEAFEKANYAATEFMRNEAMTELLKEVINEATGAQVLIEVSDDYNSGNWAYIDHQSIGLVPTDKEGLKQFIFNKNSWLFGGNDNETAQPEFYHVPEYKGDQIIEPQYKYTLSVEGISEKTRLLTMPTAEELKEILYGVLQDVEITEAGVFREHNWSSRERDNVYTFNTWQMPVDLEEKIVYFTRSASDEADMLYRRKYPEGDKDWKEYNKIEKKLYKQKNSPFVKAIKFEINEI